MTIIQSSEWIRSNLATTTTATTTACCLAACRLLDAAAAEGQHLLSNGQGTVDHRALDAAAAEGQHLVSTGQGTVDHSAGASQQARPRTRARRTVVHRTDHPTHSPATGEKSAPAYLNSTWCCTVSCAFFINN